MLDLLERLAATRVRRAAAMLARLPPGLRHDMAHEVQRLLPIVFGARLGSECHGRSFQHFTSECIICVLLFCTLDCDHC